MFAQEDHFIWSAQQHSCDCTSTQVILRALMWLYEHSCDYTHKPTSSSDQDSNQLILLDSYAHQIGSPDVRAVQGHPVRVKHDA